VTGVRSFHHREFPAAELADRRGSTTISVCLPARDEADTVGTIVRTIAQELCQRVPLVDEIIVIDDHSHDATAEVASAAGATVIDARTILPEYGDGHGKGGALWKSLYASSGDIVVWCDADVRSFSPAFVTGLVGVLLTQPDVQFVKGFYDRPLLDGDGGGRVTELVARPLLALLFPELNSVVQPLAGEYAGRRDLLEKLPFVDGYGVDLALMVDVVRTVGLGALAQVDLGERVHRNRSLSELGPQALAVLHTALHRTDPDLVDDKADLIRPGRPPLTDLFAERPPLVDVPGYPRRR
jgi:glucosyl-3-phosphoglycerate synthase